MEAVEYLMGAYFHQDWVMDGGQSADTVGSFLNERSERVAQTADELDVLLRQQLAEGALRARLDEWGCDYHAGDTDDDYRVWLTEIRDQLRSFLATSAAS